MNFATQVKQDLLDIINEMSHHTELYSMRPGKDFSRNRKLDFASLLHLCISMEAGSVREELLRYFSYDPGTISNSAFFQQRAKLSPDALPFLFRQFNSLYLCTLYRNRFQLLACNGSSFTFTRNPHDPDSYFAPDGKSTNGYNQIHVVALFDLLSKRYCDTVVQPIRKKNEFQALYTMIDRYSPPENVAPVYIADRGFHSFNVFTHAIENDAFFLIRAKDVNMRRLLGNDLPDGKETFDVQVDRILARSHSKKKRLHLELEEQYRFVCSGVTFDYIDPETDPEYPISLRILWFPISENSYENIITNLPASDFPLEEIKNLYNLRWGIETSFRELKYTIGAMNFHSKKRAYIEMEIWFRIPVSFTYRL